MRGHTYRAFLDYITGNLSGMSDEVSLKEGNVENGGVVIDELEQEHFQCQRVVELELSAGQFLFRQIEGQSCVDPVEH